MRRFLNLSNPAIIVVLLIAIGGCQQVPIQERQFLVGPIYAPTQPDTIEILTSEPQQPVVQLGELRVTPQSGTTMQQIEKAMQKTAAPWGANAVVIVSDRTQLLGTTVSPGWYGPLVTEDLQQVIVGVAVRYVNTNPPSNPGTNQ